MRLLLLALGLLLPALSAPAQVSRSLPARPLPPVPDSLREVMRRADTPAKRQAALLRVADAYIAFSDTGGIMAYTRQAAVLARQRHDNAGLGGTFSRQGSAYSIAGQYDLALRMLQLALPLQVGTIEWANSQSILGGVYRKQGRTAEALTALRAAGRAFSGPNRAYNLLKLYNSLGTVYYDVAPDSAEYYLIRAAQGFHQLHGHDYQRYEAAALGNLAVLYNRRQDYRAGSRYTRQALALNQQLRDSAAFTSSFNALAICAMNMDSLPQAIRYARQALWLGRHFHKQDAELAALNNLGASYDRLHQPDSAEAYYQRSLAATYRPGNGKSEKRGYCLQQLATLYYDNKRPADALRRALEVEALDSVYRLPTTTLNNLKLLGKLAYERHADSTALRYFRRQRALELRQAKASSSKEMAALRVRFDTERTEQQLALATARAEAQTQRAATEAARATNLRLLGEQHDATYRDTLSQRDRQRLLQQLLTQQQAAQVERAGQQVSSLTQRTRAQAQQARLQQALAAQQQQRLWTLAAVLAALLAGLAVATVLALRLRRSRNELAVARATQDRLYALVAHDLRSPVTAFEGLSDLLDHYVRRQDTAALAGLGGMIQQAAHSLRGLLENLLHWALHQRGELVAHPQAVAVADVLAEAVALYQATALAANITLTQKTSDAQLRLWADAQMSRTIVRNLVGNALKATPAGGRVTLTAVATAGAAIIEVRDSGPGFGDGQLNRPSARRPQGAADRAGLGLLLSHTFAQAQGGTLALRNAPEGGAVAVLTLPLAAGM